MKRIKRSVRLFGFVVSVLVLIATWSILATQGWLRAYDQLGSGWSDTFSGLAIFLLSVVLFGACLLMVAGLYYIWHLSYSHRPRNTMTVLVGIIALIDGYVFIPSMFLLLTESMLSASGSINLEITHLSLYISAGVIAFNILILLVILAILFGQYVLEKLKEKYPQS